MEGRNDCTAVGGETNEGGNVVEEGEDGTLIVLRPARSSQMQFSPEQKTLLVASMSVGGAEGKEETV